MVQLSSLRMTPVYEKMAGDSEGRLDTTLKIFRACRFFNYKFVSTTPLQALMHEIVFVTAIPYCYDKLSMLEGELKLYKNRAFLSSTLDPISLGLLVICCTSTTTLLGLRSRDRIDHFLFLYC